MAWKVRSFETILTVFLISISMFTVSPTIIPIVQASPNGTIKPLNFYFHNDTSNPWVGTGYTRTTATLNTTRKWLGTPQGFVNVSGTLVLEFYVHPDLAANVTLSGTLWLHPWMSGWTPTGATPKATFKVDIYEVVSPTGPTKVASTGSSGSMDLAYGSTPAHSRDVNSVNGNPPLNLTFTSHTFTKGSSILLHIEIVPGAGVSMSFYYDNRISPSFVTLYTNDYAQISSLKTYDASYTVTNVYSVFWNESQRKVIVQANVSDPFGGYDIYMVNVTILDPRGQRILGVDNVNMTRTTDGSWKTLYSNLYEAEWSYPSTAMSGNYTVMVTVVDYNGFYSFLDQGTFGLHIENASQMFSIGVQYLVQIRTVDAHSQILANASVKAVSADVVLASGYTNSSGWWTTGLWAGHYNITVFWQGVQVAKELIEVANQSSFTIQCQVYYPSFKIVDDVNNTLPEAEVYITSPNGTTTVPPLYTAQNGYVNLTQAPGGSYEFMILWKGVTVKETTLTVNSDGPYTLNTEVYQLTVRVLGNDRAVVSGAYVIVYTQSGVGYGLEITDAAGQAVFRLPKGTYKFDVRFSSIYWLMAVTSQASEPSRLISSSETLTIILEGFPPALWTALGFWLLVVFLTAPIIATVFILYKKGKILVR